MREIGNGAFSYCKALVSLELSEGLEIIGRYAFHECRLPRNISVPPTVTDVGSSVFLRCRNIRQQFLDEDDDIYNNDDIWEEGDSKEINNSLTNSMKDRFVGLPIHKLCYFQFHHSMATTIKNLQGVNLEDDKVDAFGMTPFHILALSNEPNFYLFTNLIERCSLDTLSRKDVWGLTPLHYLCLNQAPDSISLIRHTVNKTIMNRLASLGLQRWKKEIVDRVEKIDRADASTRVGQLCTIHFLIAKYERLEAMALLQEVFWKAKLTAIDTKLSSTGRHECWVTCGADIVFSNILPFLHRIQEIPFDYLELSQHS